MRAALRDKDWIDGMQGSPNIPAVTKKAYVFGYKLGAFTAKIQKDQSLSAEEKAKQIEDY